MRQSFSYPLLITWFLLLVSCQHNPVKTNYDTQNILVSVEAGSMDSSIIAIYEPYKEILDKDMNRVISVSETSMEKDRPESLLTNFLGDLLLEEGTLDAQEEGLAFKPDVSYYNYGGIRAPIPKGEITVGNAFELMPFENEMVFLQLDGDKMKAFLDYVARHGGDCVGGVRFVISDDKATHIKIGGKDFDPNNTYWIVTNDYVAAGGDDLPFFRDRKDFINSGKKIRDIIIHYCEEHQKNNELITAKPDGRISYE